MSEQEKARQALAEIREMGAEMRVIHALEQYAIRQNAIVGDPAEEVWQARDDAMTAFNTEVDKYIELHGRGFNSEADTEGKTE